MRNDIDARAVTLIWMIALITTFLSPLSAHAITAQTKACLAALTMTVESREPLHAPYLKSSMEPSQIVDEYLRRNFLPSPKGEVIWQRNVLHDLQFALDAGNSGLSLLQADIGEVIAFQNIVYPALRGALEVAERGSWGALPKILRLQALIKEYNSLLTEIKPILVEVDGAWGYRRGESRAHEQAIQGRDRASLNIAVDAIKPEFQAVLTEIRELLKDPKLSHGLKTGLSVVFTPPR